MTQIIAVVRLRRMPLILKMATPQQMSWCVLQLVKKESVTTVQHAFYHKISLGWMVPVYFIYKACTAI
jgi:hypothetical protein